jgi:hypothetical protein
MLRCRRSSVRYPTKALLWGLYIFDRTPAEAQEIMGGDPEVWAGVFVFDVHLLVAFPGK